jgi:hypothetical protein
MKWLEPQQMHYYSEVARAVCVGGGILSSEEELDVAAKDSSFFITDICHCNDEIAFKD